MQKFDFETPVQLTKKERLMNNFKEIIYCCLIVSAAFLALPKGLYIYISCVILYLLVYILLYYKYWKKYQQKYTNISFELISNKIIITECQKEVLLSDFQIKQIKIKFDNIKGTDVGIRSYIPSSGDKNLINILLKNGNIIKKKILIPDNESYHRLKLLGHFLQNEGFNVGMKGFY